MKDFMQNPFKVFPDHNKDDFVGLWNWRVNLGKEKDRKLEEKIAKNRFALEKKVDLFIDSQTWSSDLLRESARKCSKHSLDLLFDEGDWDYHKSRVLRLVEVDKSFKESGKEWESFVDDFLDGMFTGGRKLPSYIKDRSKKEPFGIVGSLTDKYISEWRYKCLNKNEKFELDTITQFGFPSARCIKIQLKGIEGSLERKPELNSVIGWSIKLTEFDGRGKGMFRGVLVPPTDEKKKHPDTDQTECPTASLKVMPPARL